MIKKRLTTAPSGQILDQPTPFWLSETSRRLGYEDRRWKLLNLRKDEHFFNFLRMLHYRPLWKHQRRNSDYLNIVQLVGSWLNNWSNIHNEKKLLYMIKNIDQYSNETSTISIKLFLWCILLRFYYCQMHKGSGCWMLLFWLTVRTSNYSQPS